MNNKLIIILICLLASCQSYRAERKINKLKEWGYLSDSVVTKYDTLRGYEIDTLVQFDTLHHTDTLFTYQNGLKVTTIVKWKERQVKQILTQKDTIYEHKYTTKVITKPTNWWNDFKIVIGIILFTSLLWILGALVKQEKQ